MAKKPGPWEDDSRPVEKEYNPNVRKRKADDRPPRDDKTPDTPAGQPTRQGGLSGGFWKRRK